MFFCTSQLHAAVTDDLPVETIIIAACVCGGVVVILSIILVVVCWQKRLSSMCNKSISPISPVKIVKKNFVLPVSEELKPCYSNLTGAIQMLILFTLVDARVFQLHVHIYPFIGISICEVFTLNILFLLYGGGSNLSFFL